MCSWILEKFPFDVFKLKFKEYRVVHLVPVQNKESYLKYITWILRLDFLRGVKLISGLNYNFMKIYAFYKV